jgi:hypothetical protein
VGRCAENRPRTGIPPRSYLADRSGSGAILRSTGPHTDGLELLTMGRDPAPIQARLKMKGDSPNALGRR